MRYNTILIDLDGTLTDSKIGITKSVQHALGKMGIIENDLDKLEKFIGPPLVDSFMEYCNFDEKQASVAISYYREYYSVTGIYENTMYSGIEKLLELLKNQGKNIVLATSKPTVFAEIILKHFDVYSYFSLVVGSNLDGTRGTKGQVIKYILDNIKENSKNIIMIGDRKHDIIGADENNIDSIGVTYGYGSKEEMAYMKPTYVVNSVQELIEFFKEV